MLILPHVNNIHIFLFKNIHNVIQNIYICKHAKQKNVIFYYPVKKKK